MNILFLTLSLGIDIDDSQSIYGSLIKELLKNNNVYSVSPTERRNKQKTHLIKKDNYQILKVRTGNIQKTDLIEKGISTILIEMQFKRAIKKYFKGVKFDLVLYATPPITFCNVIKYIKKRDNARTYLMLKDIFPQNAVDLNMLYKKSIIYRFFRRKEINLYKLSDKIGCMSQKNKEYLLKNNHYLDENNIEIFPNSINVKNESIRNMELNKLYRDKYNIPLESKVFMYGGNLGKPQGIPFIIECLKKVCKIENTYWVICGKGTEYKKLEDFKANFNIDNLLLINGLPKNEYNELLNIADIGLVFLDYNFTIPNFPSRILSYMEKGIPIISCTDSNTDIGNVITENKFGWKCYSNNVEIFYNNINQICNISENELNNIGYNGRKYLEENYNSENVCNKLEGFIKKKGKRILVVNFAALTGGALSVLYDYYEEVKNDTQNEYIFLLNNKYFEENDNIKIEVVSQYKPWIKRLYFDHIIGRKYVKKYNPDIVFSMQNTVIRHINIKQILYVHQSIPFQNTKKFSLIKKCERKFAIIQYFLGMEIKKSIRLASKVIVQTKWMANAVKEKCRIDEARIKIVSPRINCNISKNKNIYSNNTFFYPTSDAIYKNNNLIYKASELLNSEGIEDFKIELTTQGNDTNNIKNIGKISREKVFEKYKNSILIFPSYIESCPLPLIEGMMSNSIILASDTQFSREILESYENAYFFNPFDKNELKDLMKKCINKEISANIKQNLFENRLSKDINEKILEKDVLFITNIPSPYRVNFFNEYGKYVNLDVIFEREKSSERDKSWDNYQVIDFNQIFIKSKNIGVDKSISLNLLNKIKKNIYDEIFVTSISSPSEIIAVIYMIIKKIKYNVEIDGALVNNKNKYNIKEIIKRIVISNAQKCFSTSEESDKYLLKYGAKPNNIIRYPFTSLYKKDIINSPINKEEKKKLRKNLGIVEEKIIIAVGRFIYIKGFDILLKACNGLNKNVGVYIIGGVPTEEYNKIISDYKINNVHFIDFISNDLLNKYMQSADIFVLPTRSDVWGLVINEAMANALPIITTDRCIAGLELVTDGQNGYIIESENIEQLKDRINKILRDSENNTYNMKLESLKRIENYTFEKMVEKHIK